MSITPGPQGGRQDLTANDAGTNVVGRSPTPGSLCASRDPNVLQRIWYVNEAWEMAKYRFGPAAIIAHTEKDFHDLIVGALPMLLVAAGAVLATTIIGAIVGGLFGGVGAVPGAVIGFGVGLELLEAFGLGFLAVYIKDRLGEITAALYDGAVIAWKSCGDRNAITLAAQMMAEAIGLFYAALLQALLLYLGGALAGRTLKASRALLRESKLFKSCESLEAWINKNFADLYRKHLGEEPPGVLPPMSRLWEEWQSYIDAMELRPPQDRGVLWSKLGDKGQKAASLAAERGLTTLEMLLKDNGFMDAYGEAFGEMKNDVTGKIWEKVSGKYARSLRGKVTAFIDDARVLEAIQKSPVKSIETLKPGEPAIVDAPIFTQELMEISDVMENNPSVTFVDIRDVSNPNATIKIMSREAVLKSSKLLH